MTVPEQLTAAAERLRDGTKMAGIVDADIAGPLAELLDYQAQYADLYARLAGSHPAEPHPDVQTRRALAVARALLGSQP